jgi:hypothetical protein
LGTKVAIATVLAVSATGAYVAMQPAPPAPKAPSVAPPAPTVPIPAPVVTKTESAGRVQWKDTFEDLAPWAITEWRKSGGILFEPSRDTVRSAPAALRLRYTYPKLKAESLTMDEWLVNQRTVGRELRVPKDATRVRMWVKVLSAEPEARIYLSVYPDGRNSSWGFSRGLNELGREWALVQEPLGHITEYWERSTPRAAEKGIPVLRPEEMTYLELGFNFASAEVLVDDLEFIQDERPSAAPPR